MHLNASVFDFWTFARTPRGIEFLVLETSAEKAARHFNGGSFWQIPSGVFHDGESVPSAAQRDLGRYGLDVLAVWAGEHAYTIYNRRFHEVQIITVFAVEVTAATPRLDPDEHGAFAWLPFDRAIAQVHFRGLKDGLRSVHEYITGVERPAPELCLYSRADQS